LDKLAPFFQRILEWDGQITMYVGLWCYCTGLDPVLGCGKARLANGWTWAKFTLSKPAPFGPGIFDGVPPYTSGNGLETNDFVQTRSFFHPSLELDLGSPDAIWNAQKVDVAQTMDLSVRTHCSGWLNIGSRILRSAMRVTLGWTTPSHFTCAGMVNTTLLYAVLLRLLFILCP